MNTKIMTCLLALVIGMCFSLTGCTATEQGLRNVGDKVVEMDEWVKEHMW